MLFCPHCKVKLEGAAKTCPLCQGAMEGESQAAAFPKLTPVKHASGLFLRIVYLIAAVVSIVCVGVNYMVGTAWWSLFVVAGIACACISISLAVFKKANLMKNILWQLFIVSVLAVLWDIGTQWRGWSLDFVFPISCVVAMLSMAVLVKILRSPGRDFVFYLIFDALFGVLPLLFLAIGLLKVVYPSVICVCCSLISIAVLLLFEGKHIKDALTRKLHV